MLLGAGIEDTLTISSAVARHRFREARPGHKSLCHFRQEVPDKMRHFLPDCIEKVEIYPRVIEPAGARPPAAQSGVEPPHSKERRFGLSSVAAWSWHFRIVIHCHTQAPRNSPSIASSEHPSAVRDTRKHNFPSSEQIALDRLSFTKCAPAPSWIAIPSRMLSSATFLV